MTTHYLESGEEVSVLATFEGGFVIERVYDNGPNEEPHFGGPECVTRVYDEPPVSRVSKQIESVETSLKEATAKLHLVRAETKSLLDQKAAVEKMCGTYAAIKRVYDFLVTGITHVVEEKYGRVTIIDVKKTQSGDDRWSRDLNPFTNESDAVAFAKQRIESLLIDPENKYWMSATVANARAFGVEVSQAILDQLKSAKIEDRTKALAERQQQVAAIQSEIDKINAGDL